MKLVEFNVVIKRFGQAGDKTGWTYFEIPRDIAEQIMPGQKRSFKVKGFLDNIAIAARSVLPSGDGNFILALNAPLRKSIGKNEGASLKVRVIADATPRVIPDWMTGCLEDEPAAKEYFFSLNKSHQDYFIKWIDSAKTEATRIKRLAQSVTAFTRKMNYGEMIRWSRNEE